jgi:hypothetical protein
MTNITFGCFGSFVPENRAKKGQVEDCDIMAFYVEIPKRLRLEGKMNLPEPVWD